MKKHITGLYFLVLILLLTGLATSQELPYFLEAGNNTFELKQKFSHHEAVKRLPDEALAAEFYFRPYDVQHYDITLDWYDMMNKPMKLDSSGFGYIESEDVIWSGVSEMTVRIDTISVDEIRVDSRNLKIKQVSVNDQVLIPVPSVINDELIIPLQSPATKDEILKLKISYVHDRFAGKNFRGFFLYPKRQYIGQVPVGDKDSVFVEERLAYTMNEPQDARFWLPCNDSPHDKATVNISVKVPQGFSVASNGLLKNIVVDDTSSTFIWSSKHVMTTYLFHAAASNFKEWSDWYHKVSSPGDSIEVKYYTWQKDFDATKKDQSEYNANWAFEQNIDQLKCYSTAYGEYPYEKYGIVSLQPFNFGGMEHQTITSINRQWLRTNARGGLAHELAHMWLGDLITCKTWNDIWINEGGATFSEAIWTEYIAGRDYYFLDMLGKRSYYLIMGGSNLPPIYGLPINTIFGSNAVLVYQKASWIYHMLRTMVGDSVFFPALRNVIEKNKFTSINSQQFENAFAEEIKNSPIALDIYFKQWLMKTGHPVFSLDVTTSNGGKDIYNSTVYLSQVQPGDSISDIFEVPVRIVFKSESGDTFVDTLLQKTRYEAKTLTLPFYPTEVTIDTTHILCQIDTITTTVRDNVFPITGEPVVYPNPASVGSKAAVVYGTNATENVSIVLTDIFGRQVNQIYSGVIDAGSYRFDFQTAGLSSGTYFVVVKSGGKLITTRLSLN